MYGKLLLTVDGSALSEAAIPHAATLAGGSDTEVVVLEVIESLQSLRVQMAAEAIEVGGTQTPEQMAESTHFVLKQNAEKNLDAAEAKLKAAGVAKVTTLVRDGYPGNGILDVAQSNGCGAVVMATRGHSGLGREVVGSTAEYVLRHAGPLAVVLVGPRSGSGEGA